MRKPMGEILEDFALNRQINKQGGIRKIGVVGCGAVGQEITKVAARSGIDVVFVESSDERVAKVFESLDHDLDNMIARWGITASDKRLILSRISGSSAMKELSQCDLVIEAISTATKSAGAAIEFRRNLFREIEEIVPRDTVLSSNASTLLVSDLGSALKHPERMLGLSFMVSPTMVKTVEVVKGWETSEETFTKACRFVQTIGKKPVEVRESPGNISTRLIIVLINEACEIFLEGTASIEGIDQTMKFGYGLQSGPFEMADKIGIDRIVKYADNLFMEFGLFKFKPSPILKRLARSKQVGRRSGRGFYLYDDKGKNIGLNLPLIDFSADRRP